MAEDTTTSTPDLPGPVRWFDPGVLFKTGAQTAGWALFETYFDKREMQAALPVAFIDGIPAYREGRANGFLGIAPPDPQPATVQLGPPSTGTDTNTSGPKPVVVSFAADTGDDGHATRQLAHAMTLPATVDGDGDGDGVRPSLVILGGDEVYPSPAKGAYADRFVTPFGMGCADTVDAHGATDNPPHLLALPGNHDWYDGLNGFMRLFAQGRTVAGCRTAQGRSYWTVNLPGPWWIWGADIEFGTDVDGPQRAFFADAASALSAGDRVVLCISKPVWYDLNADAQGNLTFLRSMVEQRLDRQPAWPGTEADRPRVVAVLTGDHHHYARHHTSDGTVQCMTSGGGGAFAHGPVTFEEDRELGPTFGVDPEATREERRLQAAGPTVPSRRECKERTRRLPFGFVRHNPLFGAVPAVLSVLYLAAALSTPQIRFKVVDGDTAGLRSGVEMLDRLTTLGAPVTIAFGSFGALVLTTLVIALCVAFARPGKIIKGKRRRLFLGVPHGLAQLGVVLGSILVFGKVAAEGAADLWDWLAFALAAATGLVAAWVGGSVVMGSYLYLAWRCGLNGNETFSALRGFHRVHFLRIAATETELTIAPLQVTEDDSLVPIEAPLTLFANATTWHQAPPAT